MDIRKQDQAMKTGKAGDRNTSSDPDRCDGERILDTD